MQINISQAREVIHGVLKKREKSYDYNYLKDEVERVP